MATTVNKPPAFVTVVIVVAAVAITSLVFDPFGIGIGSLVSPVLMAVAITLVLHAIYWAVTSRRA